VHLVAAQPAGGAELADLGLDLVLQRLKPAELFLPPGQPLKVGDDQRADRGVTLRRGYPSIAVDVIRDRDRDVLHSFTVSQFLCGKPCSPLRFEDGVHEFVCPLSLDDLVVPEARLLAHADPLHEPR